MVSCWEKVQKMLNTQCQLAENNNKKVMSLSQTSIFYKVYAIGWSPHVSFLRVKKWVSLLVNPLAPANCRYYLTWQRSALYLLT